MTLDKRLSHEGLNFQVMEGPLNKHPIRATLGSIPSFGNYKEMYQTERYKKAQSYIFLLLNKPYLSNRSHNQHVQ